LQDCLPLIILAVVGAGVSILTAGAAPAADRAADPSKPPHIVIILADDLGYGDPGCYNAASKIPTPNIDRLAAQGMRFTDAHSPSSLCTPTRYGLMTGRYAWRSQLKSGVLWGFSAALIEPKRLTLPALLQQNGYKTACVGKWHLGLGSDEKVDYAKVFEPAPNDYGFDYYFGIPASLDMEPYVFVENDRTIELPTGHIEKSEMRRYGGAGYWRGGPIAPSFKHIEVLPKITKKAVSVIDDHAKSAAEKPLFLYFPLTAPHTPWLPTKEFEGKSKAGPFGDFVVQVDDTVGQVLAALERNKMTENTLVILTSDNGAHWLPADIEKYDHRCNGALRGQKSDIHEGGHRVPYIARWPAKIAAGSTCDEVICHTDVFATCAAIAGAKLPEDAAEDSFSFLPALLGEKLAQPIRPAIVHHSGDGMFAIRQGPWKLALGLGSGGFTSPKRVQPNKGDAVGQLYNLEKDPQETENLYQHEQEVVKRLTALLDRYREEGRSR
jgi:arylsulfatase A-like enzyme